MVPACRAASAACRTATRSRIGGARLALHRRLRPCAGAHRAVLRRRCSVLICGDMMLPRISTNVSVFDIEPEANPLPLFLDSIDKFRAAARGHAGAALARQAVPRPARAHRPAARAPPRPPGRGDGRPAREAPLSARPTCCRCCSSASSTCTRPPSRWARRSRTCTRCGAAGKLRAGADARRACGASRSGLGLRRHPETHQAGSASSFKLPAQLRRSRAPRCAPCPRSAGCGPSRAGGSVRAPPRSRSPAGGSGPAASSGGSSRRHAPCPSACRRC